jgi:hypothetical protein
MASQAQLQIAPSPVPDLQTVDVVYVRAFGDFRQFEARLQIASR